MLIKSLKQSGGTPMTERALTGVATRGLTLSVRYVCMSSVENRGAKPHGRQCRLRPATAKRVVGVWNHD